jgi:DNA repair protein SbcC/Rad50
VRPLRLTIRGLRSYRGECAIDFRDRGLIAIVGDTGAGKSSILEAITYALYNATTWDQRAVGQLISDGAQSMSVDLEFQARDQVWSVHRAGHRSTSRPATHRLRCLSDPSVEGCDGEAAVNRQVERLLGMSYLAFRAAVVLPQGRFQTLLQEAPAKRTQILEGIFRLTDLRSVRTHARELGQRAEVAVRLLTARRGDLLPDPASTAAALEAEMDSLQRREGALVALRAEVQATQEAVGEARRRAAALRDHAARVSRPDCVTAARLADLVPLAAAIDGELAATAGREAETRLREQVLSAAGAEAARVRESAEELAAAAQLLEGVRQTLGELEAAGRSGETETGEIDAEAAALGAAATALLELEEASRSAMTVAAEAVEALAGQRELVRAVAGALRTAREAAGSREAAAVEERRREEALPALRGQVAGRELLTREAASALEIHRLALDEARRRHAAAHAAEGLRPGDPCPVCGRPLTGEFQPPAAGALQPLARAVTDAEAVLTSRRAGETTARNLLDEAERRLGEAATRREAAGAGARSRLDELRDVLPIADLEVDDAVLLLPLREREEHLAGAAARSAEEHEGARDRLRTARTDVIGRQRDVERRREHLERERQRIDAQRARCGRQLGTLPTALTVSDVSRPGDLDDVIAATQRRLAAARDERRELDDLRAALARLATAGADLQRRLRDEVEAPRRLAMRSAAELLLRVNDGLRALGRPTVEAASSEDPIAVEARWAAELEQRAARLRRQLEEEIAAVDRTQAAAADDLTRRLATLGLADAGDLDRELRSVSQQVGRVRNELDAAAAQIPQAADLDGRMSTGTEIRDSLAELQRLLQDGQFVGHVIGRRQRQLLVVASQILGTMTGGAYGFSPDFDIVDRFTNQPRPTRTLSGGETFLASLALALALVEIAGRSGIQLDALFLDEGFGSLDADALDEALSVLELQASQGRLVAVVSHVRAVAERIETVLEVTRSAGGSRAEWRGPAEREQMLTEELQTRLLA